ncbi:MAG TPA: DUF1707 domain-containing protein [Streptosporangiaceae bacterium]|jgi:hypothetical protein
MSARSTPAPPQEPSFRSRASYANPGIRVSDAERAEVADRLSRHYGDGRLDEAEFSRRLDQAMGAVTQADLAGLFADLPDRDPGGPDQPRGRAGRRRAGGSLSGGPGTEPPPVATAGTAGRHPGRYRWSLQRVLGLALIVVVAIAVGHVLSHLLVPWLVIALLVVLWLRFGPAHRRRY